MEAPIPFSKPAMAPESERYLQEALRGGKISGDHSFTSRCHSWLEKRTGTKKALLTTSGTHALEMASLLAEIREGDEVIMPSFTFSSTANAFVLRGARIVFIDVRPDTMNMDETLIEAAITSRTRAIVPVHYAGVACELDLILEIAKKHRLIVIEDAAQAVMATYKDKALGTLGDFGCYSFHETKNYTCGEGGALLIGDGKYIEKAEIVREKGTNRAQYFREETDKYTWLGVGSSYLPSDLNAALLLSQLEHADVIMSKRLSLWNTYATYLRPLADRERISMPFIPRGCNHNAHCFYIKVKDLVERTKVIDCLRTKNIWATFHYVPLHSSPAGMRYGRFEGVDQFTTNESNRLVRLPLFFNLSIDEVGRICDEVATILLS